ncbi:two component sensor histidine kinase, putative [Perkinsus marinus ATCC 50983]|uniref:histidine kinase n=1 Tax=Perkinsus marinus (strain ATCC 50983 / TXsc) TaxID=423536 RepID=C5LQX9_PERM5|nr:two component sensor histidine kinase, putative [Perkinsus marinus ATCC 50983]EER00864.1 two component sensor histidine kinase, putative [Perkinsus marinus ATCC 50983]|eukprot:XP_002768146.1 two component sensor histidine kinase, putative [Perkinsus marinus ATCC 50983]
MSIDPHADLITEQGGTVWLIREDCGQLVHDLKTPFNGVVGLTEAMKVMVRDEGKMRLLTMINRAGTRLAEYVERTLEIDELSRGTMFMQQQEVDIGLVILEAVELMRYAEDKNGVPVRKASVELIHDCPPEWSEGGQGPVVEGDDMKISRVIYHIVDNALRYTEAGSVRVSARAGGEFVTIVVADTGIGIDPSRHDEIFTPFCRLAYPSDGCLGLGLSVVLETLYLMGGSIAVHSLGRGQGTTVTVKIPFKMTSPVPLQTFDRGPEGFGLYLDLTKPRPSQRLLMKRMVGLLAHELRIPFLGVIGSSDYLARIEEKKPLQKQLSMINRCGARLVDVIDVVRDAALMLESPVGMEVKSVKIPLLVEKAYKQLDVAKVNWKGPSEDKRNQPMKKREVNFFNECPSTLPEFPGEELKLFKVIEHVAENALKFTNKGHVRIDAKATREMITIIVEDTGIGIAEADQSRVFLPFVRLEPHNYYGLGLGLTVVYEIVKLAGGSVQVESAKDKGTTVSIHLPTARPKAVHPDPLDAVFVEASRRLAVVEDSGSSPLRSAEENEPVARESMRSKASRVNFVKEPTSFTGSYHDVVGSSKAPSVVCLDGGELVSQHAEEERLETERDRQEKLISDLRTALKDWQRRCEYLENLCIGLEREKTEEKDLHRLEQEKAAAIVREEELRRQLAEGKRKEETCKTTEEASNQVTDLQSRLEEITQDLSACQRELEASKDEVRSLSMVRSGDAVVKHLRAELGRANRTVDELREKLRESKRKRTSLKMDVERLRSGKARDVSFMQAVEQLRDVASNMQQEIENHVSRRGVETCEALRCMREENEQLRVELASAKQGERREEGVEGLERENE